MKFQDYRTLFQVASLTLALLAASPALSIIASFPRRSERLSELWLLDSNNATDNYPFDVRTGEVYSLHLGVGNHIGRLVYYMVYAKLRNQSQPLPNASYMESSSLPSVYEFRFLLSDGGVWETEIIFEILTASFQGNSMVVESVSINDRPFPVRCSSTWDSENSGFFFQLFFELWRYNAAESAFQFDNRFVGIWLNMSG